MHIRSKYNTTFVGVSNLSSCSHKSIRKRISILSVLTVILWVCQITVEIIETLGITRSSYIIVLFLVRGEGASHHSRATMTSRFRCPRLKANIGRKIIPVSRLINRSFLGLQSLNIKNQYDHCSNIVTKTPHDIVLPYIKRKLRQSIQLKYTYMNHYLRRKNKASFVSISFIKTSTRRHWDQFGSRPLLTSLCRSNSNSFGSISQMTLFPKSFLSQSTRLSTKTSLSLNANVSIESSAKEEQNDSKYVELASIAKLIRHHDSLYYTPGKTAEISDGDYDALAQAEAQICSKFPEVLERLEKESTLGKETTRFGGRVGVGYLTNSPRKKVHHLENNPMKSLNNAMTEDEVTGWLSRVQKALSSSSSLERLDDQDKNNDAFHNIGLTNVSENTTQIQKAGLASLDVLAEPKMDGLSLSIRYLKGIDNTYNFAWAATRGNGRKGEDVSNAVEEIMSKASRNSYKNSITLNIEKDGLGSIPYSFLLERDYIQSANLPEVIEVRGEILLPKLRFEELTSMSVEAEKGAMISETDLSNVTKKESKSYPHFSNSRNAASGILLRSKKESVCEAEVTKHMRSFLQFYAYDVVCSSAFNENSEAEEIESSFLYSSGKDMRKLLSRIGFTIPDCFSTTINFSSDEDVFKADCQAILSYHQQIMSSRDEKVNGSNSNDDFILDFDVDGVVYKVSSSCDREILGSSNRAPRWAIAHKFPSIISVTKLLDVEIQIGKKTGALTPVAILDPVDIGGVKIRRASMHNFAHAQRILGARSFSEEFNVCNGSNELGVKRGSLVVVSRAGDVIPQIIQRVDIKSQDSIELNEISDKNVTEKRDFISLSHPKECPSCGSPTYFDFRQSSANRMISSQENEVENHASNSELKMTETSKIITDKFNSLETPDNSKPGQILRCGGPQLFCPPRAVGALIHAFSKPGLDINGISEARLKQLMDANLICIPSDLFLILDKDNGKKFEESIASLPGWGPKSVQNLKNVAQSVVEEGVNLSSFIYSLGIRHVGVHSSKLIASTYGSASNFLSDLMKSSNRNIDIGDTSNNNSTMFIPFESLVGNENLNASKGIGPATLESLTKFTNEHSMVNAAISLASKVPVRNVTQLLQNDNEISMKQRKIKEGILYGKIVVFTGTLPNKMSREQAQKLALEVLGAKSTPGSVSKSTDVVVEGEGSGKKVEKAKKLGIRVIDSDAFIHLVNEHQ